MMKFRTTKTTFAATCSLIVLLAASNASATTVPFVEDFPTDSASWRNFNGSADIDWSATGGPDGGSHAFDSFNFVNSLEDDTPALLRAQDDFGSSSGGFVGDWLTSGVDEFSVMVKHDAPEPLFFFARFASPFNFPAAVGLEFAPVPSGVWTELTFALSELSPQLIYEGPSTFASVFSNIGNIQMGVTVPAAMAGVDADITFSVDKAAITPEPASILGLGVGAFWFLGGVRRRQR